MPAVAKKHAETDLSVTRPARTRSESELRKRYHRRANRRAASHTWVWLAASWVALMFLVYVTSSFAGQVRLVRSWRAENDARARMNFVIRDVSRLRTQLGTLRSNDRIVAWASSREFVPNNEARVASPVAPAKSPVLTGAVAMNSPHVEVTNVIGQ